MDSHLTVTPCHTGSTDSLLLIMNSKILVDEPFKYTNV
jgi:hypothetical protein